jgi:hypothetical protein
MFGHKSNLSLFLMETTKLPYAQCLMPSKIGIMLTDKYQQITEKKNTKLKTKIRQRQVNVRTDVTVTKNVQRKTNPAMDVRRGKDDHCSAILLRDTPYGGTLWLRYRRALSANTNTPPAQREVILYVFTICICHASDNIEHHFHWEKKLSYKTPIQFYHKAGRQHRPTIDNQRLFGQQLPDKVTTFQKPVCS